LDRPCRWRAEKKMYQSRRIDDDQRRSRSVRTASADGTLKTTSG
jgi:hypothetical protein